MLGLLAARLFLLLVLALCGVSVQGVLHLLVRWVVRLCVLLIATCRLRLLTTVFCTTSFAAITTPALRSVEASLDQVKFRTLPCVYAM